ncbi:hypothetical protein OVY35_24580, partial [Salmonella enterica subsp. enterica serovar 1,4,[5],12:i:-]|nr:hypothetical protein [Salmonella enterica subsp. enterica serovar 1,4,[5],12:i:-]
PVNVVLSSSSHVEHSTTIVEDKHLLPKVLNVEHGLKLSPTIGRPPITLFGRARLGLQDSHFLLKEKENVPTKMDCPRVSFIKNEKDESVLKQDDGL